MKCQRALQVSSLVLVDNVGLSQLIEHCCYLWKQSLGCALLGSATESLESVTEIDTGNIGYDLCCVSKFSADGKSTSPYSEASYDPETGIVTFPVQTEENVLYDMDFYKDGSVAELSPQMIRLFALAVAVMWNERLDNNWLNVQSKIKDSSFNTVNESNYIDKMTTRNKEKRLAFTDELKKFEQTLAYEKAVKNRPTFY